MKISTQKHQSISSLRKDPVTLSQRKCNYTGSNAPHNHFQLFTAAKQHNNLRPINQQPCRNSCHSYDFNNCR